jgi:hydrogenase expression/formation protein HypC
VSDRPRLPLAAEPAGQPAHCDGEVCITCSDQAVEVRVVRLLDADLAIVATAAGTQEQVSVAFVDAGPGDTILVHAKEAIAVVGR